MNDRFGSGAGVLCKVCGDRASGKHYGVPSCDGCRGFFKRSIRRNLEYICKEGGKCIVDVSRRNQCQACRFAKCIEANMRREAVQHERAPKMTSVSSSTHGLSYAANLYAARHQDGLFPFQMPFATPAVAFPLDSYYMPSPYYPHLAESLNLKFNQSVSVFKPQLIQPTNYDLEIGKLINDSAISRMPTEGTKTREKDNEVSSSEEIPTMLPNDFVRLKSNQSLHDTATKLLFLSIRWAKSIPSFHQLSLVDQKRLLNESWAELFVIAASQWGLSIDEELLETSSYLKRLQTFIRHFAVLKIDHFEAACLKALVLFRCNLSEDQTPSQQILFLQNQTLCLLIEKCGGLRFGHLLLILPQIRIVGNVQSLQENLFKQSVGDIVIDKILGDASL